MMRRVRKSLPEVKTSARGTQELRACFTKRNTTSHVVHCGSRDGNGDETAAVSKENPLWDHLSPEKHRKASKKSERRLRDGNGYSYNLSTLL